jgi:hypothetical protein
MKKAICGILLVVAALVSVRLADSRLEQVAGGGVDGGRGTARAAADVMLVRGA